MSGDLVINEPLSTSPAQNGDDNKIVRTRKRRNVNKNNTNSTKIKREKAKKIDVISGEDVQENVKNQKIC